MELFNKNDNVLHLKTFISSVTDKVSSQLISSRYDLIEFGYIIPFYSLHCSSSASCSRYPKLYRKKWSWIIYGTNHNFCFTFKQYITFMSNRQYL